MKFEVHDVDLYHGGNRALKKINIDIEEREVTTLVGPSGYGRSIFLKIPNCLHDFNPNVRVEGGVKLNGKDILAETNPIEARRRVRVVFQSPNPFAKSIYSNVVYGLKLVGIKNKTELDNRAKKALEDVALRDEIKDRLDSSTLGTPGGQQQRSYTTRALVPRPEVLPTDEPTSVLDPISTSKIEDPCHGLKQHYTIVTVIHNM